MSPHAVVSPRGYTGRGSWLRSRAVILPVVLLVAAVSGYHVARVATGLNTPRTIVPGVLWPDGIELGDFALSDHDGESFGLSRLTGRWTLLTFGYTHCPDICPMTLGTVNRSLDLLREAGHDLADVQTVFVSVDPPRDDRERISRWLGYFNPDFVGVRGSETELRKLTSQVAATFAAEAPDANDYYTVSHTASLMLVDPDARLVAILGLPLYAEDIAERVGEILSDSAR